MCIMFFCSRLCILVVSGGHCPLQFDDVHIVLWCSCRIEAVVCPNSVYHKTNEQDAKGLNATVCDTVKLVRKLNWLMNIKVTKNGHVFLSSTLIWVMAHNIIEKIDPWIYYERWNKIVEMFFFDYIMVGHSRSLKIGKLFRKGVTYSLSKSQSEKTNHV